MIDHKLWFKFRDTCWLQISFKIAVVKDFALITGKHLWWSLFNNVAGLKACNGMKKRLQHRCFSVNIAKFLWTAFLQKASGGCLWKIWAYSRDAKFAWGLLQLLFTSFDWKLQNEPMIYNNFSFLARKVFETYQVYYTILLLIAFQSVFILKHIFCLPQSLFFQTACLQSLFLADFQC